MGSPQRSPCSPRTCPPTPQSTFPYAVSRAEADRSAPLAVGDLLRIAQGAGLAAHRPDLGRRPRPLVARRLRAGEGIAAMARLRDARSDAMVRGDFTTIERIDRLIQNELS